MQQAFKDENNVVIYADTREMKTKVTEILKRKCELREKQLDVADYLLSDQTACERKTVPDLLKSMMDGRLFRQIIQMKDSFESPVLIIEGDGITETLEKTKIHPNAVRGAIASIAVEFALPMIWTKTQLETAELLYAIAKREQQHERRGISIRGKRKTRSENQMQEFLVAGLPKVSTITAKKLLKHFKTPENIFTASEAQLMEVDGVGKELAKKIRKLIEKEYEKSILED